MRVAAIGTEVVLKTKEMRVLELNAQYLGIDLGMLMQQAGREVARVIEEREDVRDKRIVIVCGTGGNGGDGMVAARHLHEAGAKVEVLLVGADNSFGSRDTQFNWSILKRLDGISKRVLTTESAVRECDSITNADILVDAMLGFGLKSRVREPMQTAVKMFNSAHGRKYAVDIPTGIDSDTGEAYGDAVRADVTVTLHAPKTGLLRANEYVGELVTVRIGIPPEAYIICGPGDLWLLNQPRRPDSKKGDFGRILVVGGSDVFSGAPALSAMAALRTGADLVTVLCPEPVVGAIRSYSPNLMVMSLETRILDTASVNTVLELAERSDVVAIGPGLGLHKDTIDTVRTILQTLVKKRKKIVLDADGLKTLAKSGLRLDASSCIITPHWGELQIILDEQLESTAGVELRIERAIEAASKFNAVVLLKGRYDVVAEPTGKYRLNKTGVPAMTVGGTGDVLTGIAAALLARTSVASEAASAAAFVSGRAGEEAFKKLGDHITATDCIENIPVVMRHENV